MGRNIFGIVISLVAFGLLVTAGYYAYSDDYAHATFNIVLSLANFYISERVLGISD